MNNLDFFKALDYENGLEVVTKIFDRFPLQYAATIGLDEKPQVRPIEFKFEKDGMLYFDAAKCYRSYAELSKTPYLQICVCDDETNTYLRVSGKAVFCEDEDIIEMCFANSPLLTKQFGDDKKMIIAYFLTDVEAELASFTEGIPARKYILENSKDAPVGITIKKNTELRDRLLKLLEAREAEGNTATEMHTENADKDTTDGVDKNTTESVNNALFTQKLYDGALFLAAEKAKELWPRMDIRPIERAAIYETYDEREKFTNLAKKLLGNVVFDKPEDFTYYLNKETLMTLYKEKSNI